MGIEMGVLEEDEVVSEVVTVGVIGVEVEIVEVVVSEEVVGVVDMEETETDTGVDRQARMEEEVAMAPLAEVMKEATARAATVDKNTPVAINKIP